MSKNDLYGLSFICSKCVKDVDLGGYDLSE